MGAAVRGGWILLDEPELHLGADILVPDLAGWRRERLPHVPDAPFLDLSPDWACEVLSARAQRLDRMKDQRARLEPFDAIELELGVFWADVVLGPDE